MRVWTLRTLGILAGLFGLATILSGGNVLFGSGAAAAGHIFPFVVWFNFLAGFAYLVAAAGLWRGAPWAAGLSATLALLTGGVFAVLGALILEGAPYETRTVAAMSVRVVFWLVVAILAWPRGGRPVEGQMV